MLTFDLRALFLAQIVVTIDLQTNPAFLQENDHADQRSTCADQWSTPLLQMNDTDQRSTNFRKVVAFDLCHLLLSAEPCIP